MPTIFIALQCFQCSTMQVKQKKKSNNKWNCVVCNEKQSVRKVFFEGFLAKDVRKFVQNFNMSRQFTEENRKETLISQFEEEIDDPSKNINSCQRKRRSDWSEYLDLNIEDDHEEEQQQRGGEFDPEIVTELPKEMFKKSKLKNYSAGLKKSEGSKSINLISSKEKTNIPIIPQGTGKLCGSKVAHNEIFAENSKQMPKLRTETTQGASKWTEYLTQDDDELLFRGDDSPDPLPQWRHSVLDIQFNNQRVEDDVHPDFI